MRYLTAAIIAGVVPAVVSMVLHSLSRARQDQATPTEDGYVVRYGKALKTLVVVLAAAYGALVGVVGVLSASNWWATVFLAALFSLLLVPLYLEVFHVRIVVTQEGMQCRSPWRPGREVKWEEVTSVDFSPSLQWYRIRTMHQGTIRLHLLLSGRQTLFDLLRRKTGIEVEEHSLLG